eukprot:scaffold501_cov105-Isochrysis_galbana.AAC.8
MAWALVVPTPECLPSASSGASCAALSARESLCRRFWNQNCTWRGSTSKSSASRRCISEEGKRSIW